MIKSYREPYIIRSNDTITYRSGVTFEQIYSLYILDKNLRNSVMAAMQDLEEHIKENAASVIAGAFGVDTNDYLKFSNFANKKKCNTYFTLPNILDKLNKALNADREPIHHYRIKYNTVPPWILFKSIYFSTVVNLISVFKPPEKTVLANRLYNKTQLNLNDYELSMLMTDTLFICLDYRNVAAHGGRIYNHKSKNSLRFYEIFKATTHPAPGGFNELLFLLDLFEYKSPYNTLHKTLNNELTRHCNLYPQDVTYLGQILNINIVTKEVVYISENSNKFHRLPHCSGIKNAKSIDIKNDKLSNYVPCKRCFK